MRTTAGRGGYLFRHVTWPNPAQPGQTRPNPAQPGPTWTNPARPGPTRPNRDQPGQTRTNPARAGPIRHNPAQPDPTRPNSVGPARARPTKAITLLQNNQNVVTSLNVVLHSVWWGYVFIRKNLMQHPKPISNRFKSRLQHVHANVIVWENSLPQESQWKSLRLQLSGNFLEVMRISYETILLAVFVYLKVIYKICSNLKCDTFKKNITTLYA